MSHKWKQPGSNLFVEFQFEFSISSAPPSILRATMAGLIALLATSAALGGELKEESPTLCDPSVTQYSGYFHLRTSKLLHGKNYFYW